MQHSYPTTGPRRVKDTCAWMYGRERMLLDASVAAAAAARCQLASICGEQRGCQQPPASTARAGIFSLAEAGCALGSVYNTCRGGCNRAPRRASRMSWASVRQTQLVSHLAPLKTASQAASVGFTQTTQTRWTMVSHLLIVLHGQRTVSCTRQPASAASISRATTLNEVEFYIITSGFDWTLKPLDTLTSWADFTPLRGTFAHVPIVCQTSMSCRSSLLSGHRQNVRWPRRMLSSVSHGGYADGTDVGSDGLTPDQAVTYRFPLDAAMPNIADHARDSKMKIATFYDFQCQRFCLRFHFLLELKMYYFDLVSIEFSSLDILWLSKLRVLRF